MPKKLAETVPNNSGSGAVLTTEPSEIDEGGIVTLRVLPPFKRHDWKLPGGSLLEQGDQRFGHEVHWDTSDLRNGSYHVSVEVTNGETGEAADTTTTLHTDVLINVRPISRGDLINVTRSPATVRPTSDQSLWVAIRNSTNQLLFNRYRDYIDLVCKANPDTNERLGRFYGHPSPFRDVDPYRLLKVATEVFLMLHCGIPIDLGEPEKPFGDLDLVDEAGRLGRDEVTVPQIADLWRGYIDPRDGQPDADRVFTLPYLEVIRLKLGDVPIIDDSPYGRLCFGILREKLTNPCLLELMWSYWHEEGMLVQTLNAISRRFQNRHAPSASDPLAHLELDPLRPLSNLLWGYIQDEQHRLTVLRRAYEYDHHYGLTLVGRAVSRLRPADSRSKFLEAFHHLLNLCTVFFKEDDDTTVIADGFPLLNGLREVHLQLTEGQHNQYGDLPWTARQEMLVQQWLLAQPEMREFLPGRTMIAYPEAWMDRVDSMKRLQGWTDTSVMHFRDLGVFGEQILLSIRFGNWNAVIARDQAANWARYWRPEIQGYIHAYRAVTGVDLSADLVAGQVDATMPSVHLRRRLNEQLTGRRQGQLPGGRRAGQLAAPPARLGVRAARAARGQLPDRTQRP